MEGTSHSEKLKEEGGRLSGRIERKKTTHNLRDEGVTQRR